MRTGPARGLWCALVLSTLAGCAEGVDEPLQFFLGDGAVGDGSVGDGSVGDDDDAGGVAQGGDGGLGFLADGAVDMGGDPAGDRTAEGAVVSAGFYHSCSAQPDGRAHCWGYQLFGRVGDGTSDTRHAPVPVLNLTDVLQVSNHGYDDLAVSCAATSSGKVWCWGYGAAGRLGNGASTATNRTPVEVSGLSDAVQVAVGGGHSCALRSGGSVVCWGTGALGRLGNGSTSNSDVPVDVMNLSDAVQVSAGDSHACAVRATGEVVCWGYRLNGRLGDGGATAGNEQTPVTVSGIDDAVQVSSGFAHTCAVRSSGAIACWGDRGYGRLGDGGGTAGNEASPVVVAGISDAAQVSAGYHHTCAVRATGDVLCWGDRGHGRLGDGGGVAGNEETPVPLTGLSDVVQVSAGYWTTCAGTGSGAVHCWGYNVFGMLGDDSTTQRVSPVAAVGLP